MSTIVRFIGMEDNSLVFQIDDEIIFKIYSFYRGIARIKCDNVESIDDVALIIKCCFDNKTKLSGLRKVVVIYNDIPIIATKETCRKSQIIKFYNREFNQSENDEMVFKYVNLKNEWKRWKSDKEYSSIAELVEHIAIKFQRNMKKGVKFEDIATHVFDELLKVESSRSLLINAIFALSIFWKYGDELVEWSKNHNYINQTS